MMQIPMGTKAYNDPLGFDPTSKAAEYDPTKEVFEQAAAELFNLNSAIYRLSQTPDGKALIDFLKKNTIEAGTWLPSLAAERGIDAATAHGFAREGQNALTRDILSRIEMAASAKTPEDYINQLQMKGTQK